MPPTSLARLRRHGARSIRTFASTNTSRSPAVSEKTPEVKDEDEGEDDVKLYVVPLDPTSPPSSIQNARTLLDKFPLGLTEKTKTKKGKKAAKVGSTRVVYGGKNVTAISSLGPGWSKPSASITSKKEASEEEKGNRKREERENAKREERENAKRELVRSAVGSAVQALKALGENVQGKRVRVDLSHLRAGSVKDEGHGEGWYAKEAAVGAHLAGYKFSLKTTESLKKGFTFEVSGSKGKEGEEEVEKAWKEGEVYAEAQNLARTLMELPGNMLTPTLFAERVQRVFGGVEGVEVFVRDAGEWFCCYEEKR